MATRLEGKITIITGATSGIGEASAEIFVNEGATVVIAGRNADKGNELASRLGEKAVFFRCDVSQEDDIAALIKFTVEKYGRIDCLFNNAGAPSKGTLETVTPEDFTYSMNLLLGSVVFAIKHVAPVMKKQGSGCIINNASIAAIRMNQGGYLYTAAKAAVTHLSKAAGLELGKDGIRVNTISPGAIATPIFWGGSQRASTLEDSENERKLEKLTNNLARASAIPRSGLPADIAYGAVYLASDEGSFVTCHDLVIDGGRTSCFNEAAGPG